MDHGGEKTDLTQPSRPKAGFAWRTFGRFALSRRWPAALKSTTKQAALPARDSPELFQTLLNLMPDAVLAVDSAGTIVLTNTHAETMFGYATGTLAGQKANRLIPQSGVENQTAHNTLSGTRHITLDACRNDGSVFPIDIAISVAVQNDQPVVLMVARDVGEREAMTTQLRQTQRMSALGKLSSGIAHDFNNILSVIKINLEMCREHTVQDPSTSSCIDRCINATKLSDAMITRLLTFARETSRDVSVVNPSTHVANAVALLRHSLGSQVEIIETYVSEAWLCNVDAAQLENAVINMAVNARDAMPVGGTLTFRISNLELSDAERAKDSGVAPGEYISITVDDTGTGVSAEAATRAFEPFFTTKGPGKGTGLGLSMIFRFALQHGGTARLMNKPSAGAIAEILLPRHT